MARWQLNRSLRGCCSGQKLKALFVYVFVLQGKTQFATRDADNVGIIDWMVIDPGACH